MDMKAVKVMLMIGFFSNGIGALFEGIAQSLGKPRTLEDELTHLAAVLCIGFYGIIKTIEKNKGE